MICRSVRAGGIPQPKCSARLHPTGGTPILQGSPSMGWPVLGAVGASVMVTALHQGDPGVTAWG